MNERASWDSPRWSFGPVFPAARPTGPVRADRFREREQIQALHGVSHESPPGSVRLVPAAAFRGGDTSSIVARVCGRVLDSFILFIIGGPAIPPSLERDGPLAANLWRSGRPSPASRPANGRGFEGGSRVDPTELGREKRGFAEKQLGRLAGCSDRGLEHVQAEQESIQEYVKDIETGVGTLEPGGGSHEDRQRNSRG